MKYETKISPQGHIYLPKPLRKVLGSNSLTLFPNAAAVVLTSSDMHYRDVLKSLEIIIEDIKHQITMKEKSSDSSPSQKVAK